MAFRGTHHGIGKKLAMEYVATVWDAYEAKYNISEDWAAKNSIDRAKVMKVLYSHYGCLSWRNGQPSKPGYYFIKTEDGFECMCKVTQYTNGKPCIQYYGGLFKTEKGMRYAGPLRPPEDV